MESETYEKKPIRHAIIVAGEAPETDDEDDEECASPVTLLNAAKRDRPFGASTGVRKSSAPAKYDSLLHRKLWESQRNVERSAAEFFARQSHDVATGVQQVSNSIIGCQRNIQDASYKMRMVADTLYRVDKQLDTIISSQKSIPPLDIKDFPILNQ